MSVDPHYISAPLPFADDQSRVLKHNDTFAIFDHYGDIRPIGLGEEGLYHHGTRYLSTSVLRLGSSRPLFLSSSVKEDNALLVVDLANTDLHVAGEIAVPRGTIHLSRSKFLWSGTCYEEVFLRNYGQHRVKLFISLEIQCDYADIFEVRGTKRARRGELLPIQKEEGAFVWSYRGLDEIVRRTRVSVSLSDVVLSGNQLHSWVTLAPLEETRFQTSFHCESPEGFSAPSFSTALALVRQKFSHGLGVTTLQSSNEQLNEWIDRSAADLKMMVSETPQGPFPYAGVPWFSTPFGRDSLITALQCLWIEPRMARAVLSYLGKNQATDLKDEYDSEPGKILHEARGGEMANLGEIPFAKYYGSVDSTPLFLILAGAYWERTADLSFLREIWPNLLAALQWMDRFGDKDGDGFLEYHRQSTTGLVHQGWKDSGDSVFHRSGSLAEGPIALCEVQGYAYAARLAMARLARVLGEDLLSSECENRAAALKEAFEKQFWCEELAIYALALDGRKSPCEVITSNAGQVLFSGIASSERAKKVAETLLSDRAFSGWGIRTLADGEARYNPMSYHNGSIWPHDNSLIAYGFSRCGLKSATVQVFEGLFACARAMDSYRMPELFCGMPRLPKQAPTHYPVACSPQAWAAGSLFLLIQSSLGMHIDAFSKCVRFSYPKLPSFIDSLLIRGLEISEGSIDLDIRRVEEDVSVGVVARSSDITVQVVK